MSEIIYRLEKVAEKLPEIIGKLVFVGGGVSEILATDPQGRKPRPTEDVDCIIEVSSLLEYNKIEKVLRKSGFKHDSNIPPVICRWEMEDIILDVMPTIEGVLGFTNRWYKDAVSDPMRFRLPSGRSINIVNAIYYFATKTEAFLTRGQGNYFTSHDFEDIVFLVNGREALVEEMKIADSLVLEKMKEIWIQNLPSVDFKAAVHAHLDAYEETERSPITLSRFKEMFSS